MGVAITGETRLSVTLRLLSGASYLDCALSYGIEWCTIWRVFHETVAVLNRVLKVKTGYKERSTLERIARGFTISRSSPLYGCIGAIDGIVIAINQLRKADCRNPTS